MWIKGSFVGSHQSASDSNDNPLIVSSWSTCLLQHLPPFMCSTLPSQPCGFAHHHCILSRADSTVDILCTDVLVPLLHVYYRSRRGLLVCPLGVLLLPGGACRSGNEATTAAAGRHPHYSFTLESLGWLRIKKRWEGI